MAVLSELVNTVAKVTGMDAATVALIARHAREAGLIAMSGRGPSAATMGLTDAANLLIAVNTAKHASEVALAVPLYRQLVPYERDAKGHRHALAGVVRFGEITEQLIRAATTGILPDPFLGKQTSAQVKDDFAKGKLWIGTRFNVTFVAATLRIVSRVDGDSLVDRDGLPEYPPLDAAPVVLAFDFLPPINKRYGRAPYVTFPGPGRRMALGNRIEETTIGHKTFQAIGQLIEPQTV